jgi:hypothetical protein
VYIHIMNHQSEVVVYLGKDFRLELSDQLKDAVDTTLGYASTEFF